MSTQKINLGAAIKHYRQMAGMTQVGLAERCKFQSQSRISQYEKNTREASTEDLGIICKVLGIDVSTLMRQAIISAGGKVPRVEAHHHDLQKRFEKLNGSHQFLVLELIKGLLGEKPSSSIPH